MCKLNSEEVDGLVKKDIVQKKNNINKNDFRKYISEGITRDINTDEKNNDFKYNNQIKITSNDSITDVIDIDNSIEPLEVNQNKRKRDQNASMNSSKSHQKNLFTESSSSNPKLGLNLSKNNNSSFVYSVTKTNKCRERSNKDNEKTPIDLERVDNDGEKGQ